MKKLFAVLLFVTLMIHAKTVKEVLYISSKLKEVDVSQVEWRPWGDGFVITDEGPMCDNGDNKTLIKGVGKKIILNQKVPLPLKVTAESKADNASYSNSTGYSLYLDVYYTDGSALYGQKAEFTGGTHDWESREVFVNPSSPIREVNCWLLFRKNSGKAWFRNLRFWEGESKAENYACFDKVVVTSNPPYSGWLLRDVAAHSNFESFENGQALGISLSTKHSSGNLGANFIEATITSDGKKDRILHLVYSQALQGTWKWIPYFENQPLPDNLPEYGSTSDSGCSFANGFSRFPLACVANGTNGQAIGIDMNLPVHGRNGFNTLSNSLFVSWDIALTPEKPTATVRLFTFNFDAQWAFRGAIDTLYKVFPEAFAVRVKKQGLWMPFAKISDVQGWEDFGFAIKEGDGETTWDDAHGIQTYRYTEPTTWWMKMENKGRPSTMEECLKEVERLVKEGKDMHAKSFASSVIHDVNGNPVGLIKDTPWCNGIVWSMNSAPGIRGEHTDYTVKWSAVKEKHHGPNAKGVLEGEYIDSSECYVTHYIDTRRDHFVAYELPLTYDSRTLMPGATKYHITYEYVKGIADDIHAMGKTMMANSTPTRLWFLAPILDIMGTETNWKQGDKWEPMSTNELFYRRALCGGKPYCFLQNTDFTRFTYECSENYMKRCLAYGMYPGYFSPNASGNHYFKNPTIYNRDRPLFKKYVPLCKLVGEAGWQPITLARSSQRQIVVERFGKSYFTVFNDNAKSNEAVITFEKAPASVTDLVNNIAIRLDGKTATFQLAPENVALLDVKY
ncbi:MAG: hypothetical protein IKP00_05110 [Victivallales bacterium]|nr:hypothetical protein [Victivallales bacterium]